MSARRRRVWPLLFLVAAGVGWYLYSRHQPVAVEASYVLAGGRSGVVALVVTWRGDEGKDIDARFNYRGRSAPRMQHQSLELPPDTYSVTLTIELDDGSIRQVERQFLIEREMEVEIVLRR